MDRLLVIDDEPRIVRLLTRGLVARGFDVDGTTSALDGLERAQRGGYDLVILDLLMDDASGVTVLREARRERPDQRVLVLSALPDVESKVRCLELGASDYVTKPFSFDELVSRVRAQLRRGTAPSPEGVLSRGSLRVDVRRLTANAGTGPVALSAREFLLLKHLMTYPDEVASAEQLIRKAWGSAVDPGDAAVEEHVRQLRAKLGTHVIVTVPGAGFKLGHV